VISEKTVDHEIGCGAGVITAGVGQLATPRIVRTPPAPPDGRVEPRNGVKFRPAAHRPSRSNRFGLDLS
jgi:hypothetical protein